ncbi:MAG: hypothetical protein LQ350_006833 [Teloschistes chrysophthalmus]|nr:MAG: hypothetical protein LQ350_006833 [Niorma chrysophthalma]
MRRDPRENSRGLVDPRDAPELLDNDGYGLYGEEEVMYGNHAGPPAALGGHRPNRNPGAAARGGHRPNRTTGPATRGGRRPGGNPGRGQRGPGQGQQEEYGPWHRIVFEAFGKFNCPRAGCFRGGPCDRRSEDFLMINCQEMGYHGPPDPRQVLEFLRPRYGALNASLVHYAAERGISGNSAAELFLRAATKTDPRGQGGPAFGGPSWGGGPVRRGGPGFGPASRAGGIDPRGPYWGGGAGMSYGPY